MKTLIFLAIFSQVLPCIAQAEVSNYAVSFGPYVGGGSLSNQSKVRHSSGIRAALEGKYWRWGAFNLGPRIELGNGVLSAKQSSDEGKTMTSYDNRFFAAGLRSGYSYRPDGDEVYLAILGGWAQSTLSQDQNRGPVFVEQEYKKIQGRYGSAELGTNIFLRENFSVNLALLSSIYMANQSGASSPSQSGDREVSDARIALTEEEMDEFDSLDDDVVMKTFATSVGLMFGF